MARCVVGAWHGELDAADRKALKRCLFFNAVSRADLYADICTAHGGRPFSLTALKDHINGRCVCD